MTIQVGDRLPDVPLTIATADGPKPTTSGEFFSGKRVALFAVPGAFTPTCSARHLPSYVDKAERAQRQGRRRDRLHLGQRSVRDGRLGPARRIAKTSPCSPTATAPSPRRSASRMDGSKFGMGKRSQRYSMIVNDGVVEQLNVEAPGEYRASSAEYMLDQLATA